MRRVAAGAGAGRLRRGGLRSRRYPGGRPLHLLACAVPTLGGRQGRTDDGVLLSRDATRDGPADAGRTSGGRTVELRRRQPRAAERPGPTARAAAHPARCGHARRPRRRGSPFPGAFRRPGRLRLAGDAGGGASGSSGLRRPHPAGLRPLAGRHGGGRAVDVACDDLHLAQSRTAGADGGLPRGGGRASGGPCAPERRRGLHPPDSGLA